MALPAGAVRIELRETSKFREFVTANADNWTRYARDMMLKEPGLRLITGQLSAPFWGIATFSRNTDRNLTLVFNQMGAEKDSRYMWTAPSFVKTSVGKLRFSRPQDSLAVVAYTITTRDGAATSTRPTIKKQPIDEETPSNEAGPSPVSLVIPRVQRMMLIHAQHHVCDSVNDSSLKMVRSFDGLHRLVMTIF